jgi:hypothetical protein
MVAHFPHLLALLINVVVVALFRLCARTLNSSLLSRLIR